MEAYNNELIEQDYALEGGTAEALELIGLHLVAIRDLIISNEELCSILFLGDTFEFRCVIPESTESLLVSMSFVPSEDHRDS